MRAKISFVLLLCWLGSFSQSITVNTSTYTVPQLVTDVLVNKNCVSISNISWRTGNTNNFGSTNGIGYFTNTNSNFPLSRGVILSTGNVEKAAGPNVSELSDGNTLWSGDLDLESAMLAAGVRVKSTNATVLEFDFVPFSSNFNFNFIFASEEYGNFQCQFSDAFAFLLTNKSTGVTTNLAVVPDTSDPISVVTIRNSLYNSSCSSENVNYFGSFNGGSNAANSATNFNGQTVSMSASSTTLIPNTTYHIKLVIADGKDFKSDSAIFLGANSFNVGQDVLGKDLTVASKTAICAQETHLLTSGLDSSIYTFAWTLNGTKIGGNTPDILVDKPGTYGLTYTIIKSNCVVTTDEIVIEYYAPIITPNPVNLYQCDFTGTTSVFDLAYNTPIVSTAGVVTSYHSSKLDALVNNNPLNNNYSVVNSNLPLTVWIRFQNTITKCITTKSFELHKTAPPIAHTPATLFLCEDTSNPEMASFNIATVTATILGSQTAGMYHVSYYKNNTDAETAKNPIDSNKPYSSKSTTIFARIQNLTDKLCYTITNFDLTVIPKPIIDVFDDQYVCTSYTLLPLEHPGNYYSGPNKELPILNAGDVISTEKTIYIYHETSGTPSCSSESSFKVVIVKQVHLNQVDKFSCDKYYVPKTNYSIRYYTRSGGPTGGGVEIAAGSTIRTLGLTTVHTYFNSTEITNPCVLEGKFNITIYQTPKVLPIANVFESTSYTLPPLSVGNYYTYDAVTKIYTPATSPITTTTKLYVYATNNICRTPDTVFTVYINTVGIKNENVCISYTLPPAPIGEYRDAPNGEGNIIKAGIITKNTTIYSYVPNSGTPNVTDDDFFTITINAPFLSTPENVFRCERFLLPNQAENGEYYTLPGGPSKAGNKKLLPNSAVTKTATIYIYKPSTTLANCYNEKPWLITIYKKALIDSRSNIDQCNSYVLTPLTNGNYYEEPNGVKPIAAGTRIKISKRIYIYAANVNDAACNSENFFDIKINGVETDPVPTQLSYCESFTFPALPTPKNFYYDAPGGPYGSGNIIPFGTKVTTATVLPKYYIYYESGNRLNCTDEKSFSITVAPKPIVNNLKPLEICDEYGANDGVAQFDLTTLAIRNQILNGQGLHSNFNITYYNSFAAANDSNSSNIKNPQAYINRNPFIESVWIRLENNTITDSCFVVVELKLAVYLRSDPKLEPEYFICEDYKTGKLLNPANIAIKISAGQYKFEWWHDGVVFGGDTAAISTTKTGEYKVKVTNIKTNCSYTVSTKVIKYSPYLEISSSDHFNDPTYIKVNILGVGSGQFEYKLDDDPYQESNQFHNVLAGEHLISVNDKSGYCNPAPINVVIINYPKFFTPNGDGANETWNISHLLSTNPNAIISIFDRFGKLITQITPSKRGWDGTLNGQDLLATDYWFTVNYDEKESSKIFKAHFSLKR
ncbi:choice-of-anchor L domain-containing protein [Flavobacterium sp. PL11]|uniref:choice-of-anchor L domain-containing protein n=1 Tax=Flavobacterium sp. PL11 TaxID=3071717 RepID=UPI002E13B33D